MTLGDVIKKYRLDHGMSMADFSSISGISKQYISILEKNKHPKTGKPVAPSIQRIKDAAYAMHMDFNTLFEMIDCDVTLSSDKSEDDDSASDQQADESYYIDEKAREIAEFMHKNPDYSALFDASRKVKPENLEIVKQIIEKFSDGN